MGMSVVHVFMQNVLVPCMCVTVGTFMYTFICVCVVTECVALMRARWDAVQVKTMLLCFVQLSYSLSLIPLGTPAWAVIAESTSKQFTGTAAHGCAYKTAWSQLY